MAVHNNIHSPHEDLYFYCPNEDCPCHTVDDFHPAYREAYDKYKGSDD